MPQEGILYQRGAVVKNIIMNIFILALSAGMLFFSETYLFGKWFLIGIFVSGVLFGIFLMMLKLNVKNTKISSYKRELEKESLSSDENAAKVKVLESKIEVLEKALENTLHKD